MKPQAGFFTRFICPDSIFYVFQHKNLPRSLCGSKIRSTFASAFGEELLAECLYHARIFAFFDEKICGFKNLAYLCSPFRNLHAESDEVSVVF